jgi:hypothetical protein
MWRLFSVINIVVFSSFLTGCVAQEKIPPELQYNAAIFQNDPTATLIGSQENVSILDDYTAYVSGVDGKRVMIGRKGWNNPLPILEGKRNLIVSFMRGAFYAQTNLVLSASKGSQYQIRFSTDVQVLGTNSYCDFWIVDLATGKAVTDISRGTVSGGAQSGGPIFIPTHR